MAQNGYEIGLTEMTRQNEILSRYAEHIGYRQSILPVAQNGKIEIGEKKPDIIIANIDYTRPETLLGDTNIPFPIILTSDNLRPNQAYIHELMIQGAAAFIPAHPNERQVRNLYSRMINREKRRDERYGLEHVVLLEQDEQVRKNRCAALGEAGYFALPARTTDELFELIFYNDPVAVVYEEEARGEVTARLSRFYEKIAPVNMRGESERSLRGLLQEQTAERQAALLQPNFPEGKLWGVTGISAAGKDLFSEAVSRMLPHTSVLPRYHTRPPRRYELNGENITFVSPEFFKERESELITFKRREFDVGISTEEIAQHLKEGKNLIFPFAEPVFAEKMVEQYPDTGMLHISVDPQKAGARMSGRGGQVLEDSVMIAQDKDWEEFYTKEGIQRFTIKNDPLTIDQLIDNLPYALCPASIKVTEERARQGIASLLAS